MTEREFPQVNLASERLLLRPFRAQDAADVHAVWQDEAYLRFAPAGHAAAGADLQLAVEWCSGGPIFAVERSADGRLVGHVTLFGTDWTRMVTEIHYWTAPWGRGSGYAAESVRTVARWALITQGIARIALMAVVGNIASIRVAEAAGFRFEGVQRNAAMTRSGRGDLAGYSLIPADLEG
ncbi:RimJ/RimL family protein N-acetyltransferase [Kibdelosporangium banguiense]|uniref:RimJ/RimL family protein N-acetyltransferase n=1 Tax=Kibdelosporangium banguiense TaxID=1365924 RepID=A0ABS4TQH3_9PSEU|nr:GNAT family N-acetyltransferase [Kibdelosporangium banguiense]MBP2326662.1 RimJ/RimL family protein N-acetyltransferase [Kibdelosporangium banguiense]